MVRTRHLNALRSPPSNRPSKRIRHRFPSIRFRYLSLAQDDSRQRYRALRRTRRDEVRAAHRSKGALAADSCEHNGSVGSVMQQIPVSAAGMAPIMDRMSAPPQAFVDSILLPE